MPSPSNSTELEQLPLLNNPTRKNLERKVKIQAIDDCLALLDPSSYSRVEKIAWGGLSSLLGVGTTLIGWFSILNKNLFIENSENVASIMSQWASTTVKCIQDDNIFYTACLYIYGGPIDYMARKSCLSLPATLCHESTNSTEFCQNLFTEYCYYVADGFAQMEEQEQNAFICGAIASLLLVIGVAANVGRLFFSYYKPDCPVHKLPNKYLVPLREYCIIIGIDNINELSVAQCIQELKKKRTELQTQNTSLRSTFFLSNFWNRLRGNHEPTTSLHLEPHSP
jgi:hypothetical protein